MDGARVLYMGKRYDDPISHLLHSDMVSFHMDDHCIKQCLPKASYASLFSHRNSQIGGFMKEPAWAAPYYMWG